MRYLRLLITSRHPRQRKEQLRESVATTTHFLLSPSPLSNLPSLWLIPNPWESCPWTTVRESCHLQLNVDSISISCGKAQNVKRSHLFTLKENIQRRINVIHNHAALKCPRLKLQRVVFRVIYTYTYSLLFCFSVDSLASFHMTLCCYCQWSFACHW